MNFKHIVALFVVAMLSLSVRASEKSYIPNFQEVIAQDNDCMIKYRKYFNELTGIYEGKYIHCNKTAIRANKQAESVARDKSNSFASNSGNSCKAIERCIGLKNVRDSLKCFENQAARSSKTGYNINVNSSKELNNLIENKYKIKSKRFNCITHTENEFNKKVMEANGILGKCVLGYDTEWPELRQITGHSKETSSNEDSEAPENSYSLSEGPAEVAGLLRSPANKF